MISVRDVANFVVGSRCFFGGVDGFVSKDTDILYLMEGWCFSSEGARIRENGVDKILYPNKGLELIDDCIRQNDPITAGKFLVPEFCKYIGATIEDVKRLETLFYALDEKHRYETFIYECYVNNNGLWLTEEQRLKAYEIYKTERHGHRHPNNNGKNA